MKLITRGFLSSLLLFTMLSSTARADLNQSIVNFCQSKIGKQVGSGECAHLASEAQRVSGAEFLRSGRADSPASGDYVWGTLIKKMYKSTSDGKIYDTSAASKCRPGDIVQYRLGTGTKTHHTSVVSAVNSSGYPTQIYQQNFNSVRSVTKDSTDLIQKLKDKGGYLMIYRSTNPVNSNRTEFSIVNNAKTSSLSFTLNGSNSSIGAKNASDGYYTMWSTYKPPKITVGGTTYSIAHRSGYEFYLSGSTVKLRAISP